MLEIIYLGIHSVGSKCLTACFNLLYVTNIIYPLQPFIVTSYNGFKILNLKSRATRIFYLQASNETALCRGTFRSPVNIILGDFLFSVFYAKVHLFYHNNG